MYGSLLTPKSVEAGQTCSVYMEWEKNGGVVGTIIWDQEDDFSTRITLFARTLRACKRDMTQLMVLNNWKPVGNWAKDERTFTYSGEPTS